MRFKAAYEEWQAGRISQGEAAQLLGVCERSFRRYMVRYEAEGIQGLSDKRLGQLSHRRAPVDEILALTDSYRRRHLGWTVKHFYTWYRRAGGQRSYTWVKKRLQEGKLVKRAPKRGAHRKRRERAGLPGMMLHQDGSRHEWVEGERWDLIVTMDDATSEHYAMQFVAEEGTMSSFAGIEVVIRTRGLFSSLYTDRGSHYWLTPEVGGKVDKLQLTQFGRAMQRLGVQMIPAYSPQARGRSERAFRTHQERLTKELKMAGIIDMDAANRYLIEHYLPQHNAEFAQPAMEEGSAFIPWNGGELRDVLCERFERTVGHDNCISFQAIKLQIPKHKHRCHFVKMKVQVLRYIDQTLAIFHGPRCLARYTAGGELLPEILQAAAPRPLAAAPRLLAHPTGGPGGGVSLADS